MQRQYGKMMRLLSVGICFVGLLAVASLSVSRNGISCWTPLDTSSVWGGLGPCYMPSLLEQCVLLSTCSTKACDAQVNEANEIIGYTCAREGVHKQVGSSDWYRQNLSQDLETGYNDFDVNFVTCAWDVTCHGCDEIWVPWLVLCANTNYMPIDIHSNYTGNGDCP